MEIACIPAVIKCQHNPPWPDALIEYNNEIIGLELTELYKKKNIQNLQNFANNVVQAAFEHYKGPASSIYPVFVPGKTRETPEDIGKALANFIADAPDGVTYNPKWNDQPISQIASIRISRYSYDLSLTQSAWHPKVYFRNESIAATLLESIREKENARKADYSKKINRNWLLITMQQVQDSQFFSWSPSVFENAVIKTGFERIILCDLSFREWWEIPPS